MRYRWRLDFIWKAEAKTTYELRALTTNGCDSLSFELFIRHLHDLFFAGVVASYSVNGYTAHVNGVVFEYNFTLKLF